MMIVLGTIGIVLITIAIGVLIDRKHSILPKPTELLEPREAEKPKPAYAAGGRAGVVAALGMLRRELDLAMALCGCPDVASITRDLVEPG